MQRHRKAHVAADRTRSPAHSRRRRDRTKLRALARRVAPTARREGGASDRRPLRGPGCHRSIRNSTRTVPDNRNRRRDTRGDRRPPEGTRHPRRAHPGNGTPTASEPRGGPAVRRIPYEPPADADVPRCAHPPARSGVRESVSHREKGGESSPTRTRNSSSYSQHRRRSRSRTRGCTRRRRAGFATSSR